MFLFTYVVPICVVVPDGPPKNPKLLRPLQDHRAHRLAANRRRHEPHELRSHAPPRSRFTDTHPTGYSSPGFYSTTVALWSRSPCRWHHRPPKLCFTATECYPTIPETPHR